MTDNNGHTWRDHSRLFLACGVVILSPFQYGFDFGMIGGLQAMKGFLQVRAMFYGLSIRLILTPSVGFRLPDHQIGYRMEHHHRETATHLISDDTRCFH